jgi:nickel-dependent lactate racemase
MTGFSGGRKSICPGIVSIKTIRAHHSPKFLESPFSAPGILKRNPCHEEALEVTGMVGVDFIVNVTLDSEKRITGIFAGDLEEAHLEGVRFCEGQVCDYLEEPVDIVLTSAGGYPLDCNFYQTVKGLVGALDIVKAGGTIIIASSCIEGIGSLEFKKLLFGMKDINQFLEMINQDDYFTIDQWEVEELVKVLRKVRVRLYSTGLSNEDIINCHVQPIHSIEEGIEKTITEYGKNARIAVIPNGPYVLARLLSRD